MGLEFIVLGCGSSMGVPRPDGFFGNCNPKNKKNYRTRCSALIKSSNENILIDTSPDLRDQLLKNNIKKIDRVLYSHLHGDQTHGINDLRVFYLKKRKVIPIYADTKTSNYLKKTFGYCFKLNPTVPKSLDYPATLKINKLKEFTISQILESSQYQLIMVILMMSFIINNNCAYASDVKLFYKKSIKFFKNLKYLVIDCLRYDHHPSHLNLDETLKLLKIINPKKTYLTNLHTDMDYNILKNKLPKNVYPAFDGLKLKL